MSRKPITPFMTAQAERARKIAHLELHGARLYRFSGHPRIIRHPPVPNARMLRLAALTGPWEMTGVGGSHLVYAETPWSELQDDQLDSLEWSLIEQFTRLINL